VLSHSAVVTIVSDCVFSRAVVWSGVVVMAVPALSLRVSFGWLSRAVLCYLVAVVVALTSALVLGLSLAGLVSLEGCGLVW
jgi:hypothetical protein